MFALNNFSLKAHHVPQIKITVPYSVLFLNSPKLLVQVFPLFFMLTRVARNSQWGDCFGGLGEGAPSRRKHGGLGA